MPLLRGGERAGDKETYPVVCTGTVLGEFKTNTPYVEYSFEHQEHPEYRISCRRALTEKSFSFVEKELREALGWDPQKKNWEFEQLNTGAESPCAGVKCSIVVEEEEYDGKLRARVVFVNGEGGGPRERLSEDKAKSVADRIRGAIRRGPRSSAPASSPKPAAKPPSGPPASRTDRVRQAAGEGAARARGEPAAGGGDYDFDDIPF